MKKFILAVGFVLASFACNKSKAPENAEFCKEGFIFWGGPYAADGVGWYFAVKRTGTWTPYQLKETELPALYKTSFTDSTAVKICLTKTTERAPCFCSAPSYFYSIQSIQKN